MKEDIIILGASGHARSVMDIILENGDYNIVGCLSKEQKAGSFVKGMPEIKIIGDDNELQMLYNRGIRNVFVAIGSNIVRKKCMEKAADIGFKFPSIISKHAIISSRANIGKATCVMPGAVINVNVEIGNGCIINTNCSIDHDCIIEDYVHIAPGTAISGTTKVGEGTFIGTNSSVIDGLLLGQWSCIGAGAAVVKDVPPNALVCGVPAEVKKSYS